MIVIYSMVLKIQNLLFEKNRKHLDLSLKMDLWKIYGKKEAHLKVTKITNLTLIKLKRIWAQLHETILICKQP